MAENKIELKSVSELLGMKFFIPSYQRGYRWTKQQVEDLLNDINEFKPQKNQEPHLLHCGSCFFKSKLFTLSCLIN